MKSVSVERAVMKCVPVERAVISVMILSSVEHTAVVGTRMHACIQLVCAISIPCVNRDTTKSSKPPR